MTCSARNVRAGEEEKAPFNGQAADAREAYKEAMAAYKAGAAVKSEGDDDDDAESAEEAGDDDGDDDE